MIQSTGTVATLLLPPPISCACASIFRRRSASTTTPRTAPPATRAFPSGECRLHASESELSFQCSAPDTAGMEQMQEIISMHVGMFTKRNPLRVDWRRDH